MPPSSSGTNFKQIFIKFGLFSFLLCKACPNFISATYRFLVRFRILEVRILIISSNSCYSFDQFSCISGSFPDNPSECCRSTGEEAGLSAWPAPAAPQEPDQADCQPQPDRGPARRPLRRPLEPGAPQRGPQRHQRDPAGCREIEKVTKHMNDRMI